MMNLIPVSLEHQSLIELWFENDDVGRKELNSYADFHSWLNRPNQTPRFQWIVYEEKIPIGFTDLEMSDDSSASFSFYVAPKERGMGKGKEILKEIINEAKKRDITTLVAGVEESNIVSQKALLSVGFLPNGRDKDNYLLFKFNQ
jgi:RimJ/RimL family protein N-acetyltransferase